MTKLVQLVGSCVLLGIGVALILMAWAKGTRPGVGTVVQQVVVGSSSRGPYF